MKTEPKSHVWLVQVSGTDPDIWDTEKHAYDAAAETAFGMFEEGDVEKFEEDKGAHFELFSDQELVEWWNENREPFILVECRRILTK